MPDTLSADAASHEMERLLALRRATRLMVHAFAWQQAQTRNNHIKAVWTGGGQRRPLYGAAAKKALSGRAPGNPAAGPPTRSGSGPVAEPFPSRPAPTAPPAAAPPPPAPASAAGAPARGRLGRVAGSLGKAAVWAAARPVQSAAKAAVGVERAGRALKKVSGAAGRAIEKAGKRKGQRARAVAAALAEGGLLSGARVYVRETVAYLRKVFDGNRRKYGAPAAILMEGAFIAQSVAKRALSPIGGVTGVLSAVVPGLAVAKKFIAGLMGAAVRTVIEAPVRAARRRLAGVKRNPDAPGRVAQRMDKGGKPVALPGAVVGRARDIRSGTGPGDLFPAAGSGRSRSRRFAEDAYGAGAFDPLDFIADLRGMIEDGTGVAEDAGDDALAELVEQLADYMAELTTAARDGG